MGKYEDLTGRKFGRLLVIGQSEERINGKIRWKCLCDCGNETNVITQQLKNGHTISCGCYDRYRRSLPDQDLKGRKFGKLTVIDWVEHNKTKSHKHAWLCQCDCGNTTYATTNALVDGHKKSCGCFYVESLANRPTKDISGKRYGMLTAIKRVGMNSAGRSLWLCKCDCGNTCITTVSCLSNKNTQSCGCINSAGEYYIRQHLQKNNIPFEKQYKFDDCTGENGRPLRFDFGIKDTDGNLLCLLEFDGEQHFKVTTNPWDNEELLKKRLLYDEIKNNYCKEHNIPLVRISYRHIYRIKKSDTYLLSLIAPYIEVAA